jgi:predicted nucleic-acid-binding protein
MAARATAYLRDETELYLADLIVAETVYVLESVYESPRSQVAEAIRSLVVLPSVVTIDSALLFRAVEIYETDRLDFAEAYLVACAETTGIVRVASFDRSIDRISTVERVVPE